MAGDDGALWYKDAVIYQLHVRAFYDSNGDGIGDFGGLLQKLDYLQDLGVTALWLLPFYPSPLRDDGYDTADYTDVHEAYGSLRDFRLFLREAHRRGLRVITELVLNHTSEQHRWFQRARRAKPGSSARDFYVWSDTPERYPGVRIIFKDFESANWSWDPVANAYYWHRFYSHQPDLNYDNPDLRRAMFHVVDFWLGMGVDGLRLDAVPYLYEREGTSCENLPETHAYLKELRRHVDQRFQDKMLLAEANQWPEDAVAYFGDGDECHMAFHFPLMPRMFMATRMEDRFPVVEILEQTPAIPGNAQWATFLRNHDELTLEMVTDEERDYMYRVYADDPQARINLGIRRRLAPLLGNDRRRIELMNGLLFSMPGTPIVYYGDEIGMGDNIYLGDRNGVRTPMQWSADRNGGFSRANPQRLYLPVIIDPEYAPEAVNVEAQQANPNSLLWWMKRMIALRRRYKAFARGDLRFLYPENRKILAFVRSYEDERILVVANLSRLMQYAELDLSGLEGRVPVEVFGGTELPPVGDRPYFLTLGPHAFYWLSLESPSPVEVSAEAPRFPLVRVAGAVDEVFGRAERAVLEAALPGFLVTKRWFASKGRRVKSAEMVSVVPVRRGRRDASPTDGYLVVVRVEYREGEPESYLLPVAFRRADDADVPQAAVVARVLAGDGEWLLIDGVHDRSFCLALLDGISGRRRFTSDGTDVVGLRTRAFRRVGEQGESDLEPSVLGAEQSNTSIAFGRRYIMKLIRRIDRGVNPDLEIGDFLTERVRFEHVPPVAGWLEIRQGAGRTATLATLQGFVTNEGDAWSYTLDGLGAYVDAALARPAEQLGEIMPARPSLLELSTQEPPPLARDLFASHLEAARLLGQRTAELHLALASDRSDPAFAPEPLTTFSRRSLYQSMRGMATKAFGLLRAHAERTPDAANLLTREADVMRRFAALLDHAIDAANIRCHGDFHLGQVLWTGKDFVIIDFEGEPARPISERRIKRSALRDVAGMIRSYHYAAYTALLTSNRVRPEDREALEPWVRAWYLWSSAAFLRAYLETADGAVFLPPDRRSVEILLDTLLLEKALYEVAYEINNRPDWVGIPIRGILELLESGS